MRPGEAWEPGDALRLSSRSYAGVTVVGVAADIDVLTAAELDRALRDHVAAGRTKLVVDLSAVRFLDSTALGVLVKGFTRTRDTGGTFDLVVSDDRVLRVFRLTGLDGVMPLHATLDEALGT